MATEHTLTLKAALDTSDVQRQLAQLENQSGVGNLASSAPAAAAGVNQLGDAVKNLKISGAAVLVRRSFDQLGDAVKNCSGLSDELKTKIDGVANLWSTTATRAAQFGAVLGPLGAALGSLTGVVEGLFDYINGSQLAEAQKRLAEALAQEKSAKQARAQAEADSASYNKTIADYGEHEFQREFSDRLGGLDLAGVQKELAVWTTAREKAAGRISEIRSSENFNLDEAKPEIEKLVADIKDYDQLIDRLKSKQKELEDAKQREIDSANAAAEKAMQAEEKRLSDLVGAMAEFNVSEDDRSARQTSDLDYFRKVMDEAFQAMQEATTADQFRSAASRYTSARDYLEGQEAQEKPKELTAADWANMLSLLKGPAVSGFGAAGFGMGETQGQLDEITGQLDRIIRYMGDLVNKDLTVQNAGTVI